MSLPGTEIRVSSWTQLLSECHSRKLVQLRPEEGDHIRSPYVFRGMDVATWELATSLQRLSKKPNTNTSLIEGSLIRSFRKYANAGAFDEKSEWYVLAVAQHNGLPTRVLDTFWARWQNPLHADQRSTFVQFNMSPQGLIAELQMDLSGDRITAHR